MKQEKFTHLHLHTDASERDGLGTVPALIERAKTLGFRHIAMTDHGTLANAVTFSVEAKAAGIKPILGLEGYVAFDGSLGHITLIADGPKGWNSLLKLNNLAAESSFRQPAFSIDDLIANQDGLLCLSGCIASPLQRLPYTEAVRLAYKLKSAFGPRFFAEMMFVGDSLGWKRPLKLAQDVGLKTVITNDVHFPLQTQAPLHGILTQIKSGYDYESAELYMKTRSELETAALHFGLNKGLVQESLDRTFNIGELVGEIDLKSEPRLPKLPKHKPLRDEIQAHPLWAKKEYQERAKHELDVIESMGYEDYFIILKDLVDSAKDLGIKVGPGRGSGAGSLVLYMLGITQVDSLKYGLRFERFLNPERRGLPDVDVDFDSENRQLLLDKANEKYGAIPIATYSRYSHKSLTRDLGKWAGVDPDLVSKAAELGPNSSEFSDLLATNPLLEPAYESFLNQIRHKGKHAGGVIITSTPVPIERAGKTLVAAWPEGTKNELSYAGIVKFDLLGLSALSAIQKLEKRTGFVAPEPPADGVSSSVFDLFKSGDVSGIFQFSGSDGIRQMAIDLQPESFEDLVAISALFRPGAIDSGSAFKYADWKKKPRKVPAIFADILKPTYGAIVYQEQMMDIYAKAVGGSLAEADNARRIITKSKPDDKRWVVKFNQLHDSFVDGCVSQGLSRAESEKFWKELETHSRYSFNRSHSVAYTIISWQMAWFKHNFPKEFFAVMMGVDPDNLQTYILDALDSGIEIVPPDINQSSTDWESANGNIYMPLQTVKFFGESSAESLVEIRKMGGSFNTVQDFMNRVPKSLVRSQAREGLYMLGAFDYLDSAPNYKDLELTKEPPRGMKKREIDLKYLGFIIPSVSTRKEMRDLESKGWICGVVDSVEPRSSKYGPYRVFRLAPKGVFWSRDKSAFGIEKGSLVAVSVNSTNGRADKVKFL